MLCKLIDKSFCRQWIRQRKSYAIESDDSPSNIRTTTSIFLGYYRSIALSPSCTWHYLWVSSTSKIHPCSEFSIFRDDPVRMWPAMMILKCLLVDAERQRHAVIFHASSCPKVRNYGAQTSLTISYRNFRKRHWRTHKEGSEIPGNWLKSVQKTM